MLPAAEAKPSGPEPTMIEITATPPAEAEEAPAADHAPEEPRTLFRLYFVRHAPAGSAEDWPGDDAERPLTDKGRQSARKGGKGLRKLVGTPDAILTSPYARAQETAQIVAKGLHFEGQVQTNDHLVHGGRPEMLAQILADHAGEKDVLLVGHSPDLERWIAALTLGHESPSFLELKKGGVCRVDVTTLEPEPRGIVRWVVTPAILRELD